MIDHVELFTWRTQSSSKALTQGKEGSERHTLVLTQGQPSVLEIRPRLLQSLPAFFLSRVPQYWCGCSSSRDPSLNCKFVRVRILNCVFVERYVILFDDGADGLRWGQISWRASRENVVPSTARQTKRTQSARRAGEERGGEQGGAGSL